jgi:hypothetical protein
MKVASQNGKVNYMKYSVQATLSAGKDEAEETNTTHFEAITYNNNARIYSKEMVVLRDSKNTFSILPQKKVIYWTDTFIKENSADAYADLRKMQDSVFKKCDKVECVSVTGKAYNKQITVYLNKAMSAYMQMSSVVYCINNQNHTLHEVVVNYIPKMQFKTIKYVFEEQNSDYKQVNMTVPVTTLVFDNGTTLKKQYAAYKLIDSRKNKR